MVASPAASCAADMAESVDVRGCSAGANGVQPTTAATNITAADHRIVSLPNRIFSRCLYWFTLILLSSMSVVWLFGL